MKFTYLTFAVAIAIAVVAAWFSIVGLVAIFSASWIGAVCMGSVIEAGKVVSASWLSRYWDTMTTFPKKALRAFLLFLVLVAMTVTSGGIFGYLSKAHIEQQADVGANAAHISRLDRLIEIEQRDINDALLVMSQLDESVQKLINYDRIRGPSGARAVRESQREERLSLKKVIRSSQLEINKLEEKKFELSATVREIKTEVGPVLYIAALLYDDPETHLDSAVRWVIIVLILIFDPLAVSMILVANHSLDYERRKNILHNEGDVDNVADDGEAPHPDVMQEESDSIIEDSVDEDPPDENAEPAPPDETSPRPRKTTGWLNNQPSSKE